jgi:hypothetical protein
MPAHSDSPSSARLLDIETLADGIDVIQEDTVGFYRYNCMVCFHDNGHLSGVNLSVSYERAEHAFDVVWSGTVTDEIARSYARNLIKAADHGAVAIALLLIREITAYRTVELASLGSTIDYYLSNKNTDDDLIFNHTARLEVSGIVTENSGNTIKGRIKKKINRLKSERDLPDIICVVEFGKPCAQMVTI